MLFQLAFILSTFVLQNGILQYLMEEIVLDFDEEEEESTGYASFRKGVFRVPLYMTKESSTFFKKKSKGSERKRKSKTEESNSSKRKKRHDTMQM